MRLIDADALMEVMKESEKVSQKGCGKDAKFAYDTHHYFMTKINEQPTIEVSDCKPCYSESCECNKKKTVTKFVYLVAYAYDNGFGNHFICGDRLIQHEDDLVKIRDFIKKENSVNNVVIMNYQLIRTYEGEIEECE